MPLIGNYFQEPLRSGDWLKGEIERPNNLSRDQITLLSTAAIQYLTSGMVLGQITATGKYVQLNLAAADGSQVAKGLLIHDTMIPISVDTQAAAIVRDATLADIMITWPAGITANQIQTATGQLAANQVLVRRTA